MICIDLHSHTTASDGTLGPLELCQRASERGVTALAITDHDTVAAHQFLSQYSLPEGLQLISGIELSTTWSGAEIHIVGLNFSLTHPDLERIIRSQGEARRQRSLHIASRLAKRMTGYTAKQIFSEVLSGAAQRQKSTSDGFSLSDAELQVGRPHFAHWLVNNGFCKDTDDAFRKYLGNNKIGNLKAFWPPMSQGVAWIRAIGGTAVLAHPGKYNMTRTKLTALIKDFKYAGGLALEVQGANSPHSQIEQLANFCLHFELQASQGSDFHNPDYQWIDIGRLPPSLPKGLPPVWESWDNLKSR